MKLLCSTLAIFILATISLSAYPQKFEITQSETEAEDFQRQFFRIDPEHYLAVH